jgi:hypothetical protein
MSIVSGRRGSHLITPAPIPPLVPSPPSEIEPLVADFGIPGSSAIEGTAGTGAGLKRADWLKVFYANPVTMKGEQKRGPAVVRNNGIEMSA